MFNHLRKLKLSLAAKCELLFGIGVVLVIAAAVSIPWIRMERLTDDLNENTAKAVIQTALSQHIAYWKAHPAPPQPTTRPNTPVIADLDEDSEGPLVPPAPATQPASPDHSMQYRVAKLMLLSDFSRNATALERRAWAHFRRHSEQDSYWKLSQTDEGGYVYRYGRILDNDRHSCRGCHQDNSAGEKLGRTNALAMATVEIPSQVDPNQLALNRLYILAAATVSGMLAIVFFFFVISRLILDPVRLLQKTAEQVSEGDLNIRTHIASGDEFQVLSETFNKMLQNLKQGEDQLRALNKSLDLKLEEMAESNLALYESNRLKSEFLANVSHELRTPLNSILGFAELLKDAARNDAKSSRYVQNITSSGRSLLDLINDLLDLAKIEAGKMEVRAESLSLSDLFEGLCNILRPLIEPKTLTVNIQIANDVPLLHTDAAKLQQILYNFMSNAIKFSPAGAMIDLCARREGPDRVRIEVRDHGPGIAKDKQHMIFEKFRQIDGSHTRQHGGTGLGLAISRDLTRLLGGEIGVETAEGQGATFWIILPIKIDSSTQDVRQAGTPVLSMVAGSGA